MTAERDTWLLAYRSGDYQLAYDLIEKSKTLKKPKNQYLYFLEKAQAESRLDKFTDSNQSLQSALEYWDRLYIKLGDVIGKTALSDQVGDYWGAPFENSYHYFLSALNFKQLAQKESDSKLSRNLFFSARAQVTAWDVYFRTQRNNDELKGSYFADYLQKYYGAKTHEQLNTPSDKQIAKKLYQEALWLFEIQAPSMRLFNTKYEDYYPKLLKILSKSDEMASLEKLHQKIMAETTNERQLLPEYLETQKFLKSNAVATEKKKNNIKKHIMLIEGTIAPKTVETIDLSLNAALESGSASQAVISVLANAAFFVFASQVLGIHSGSSGRGGPSIPNAYLNYHVAADVGQLLSLRFELPRIDYRPNHSNYKLRFTSTEKNKSTLVWEKKVSLLMPFGELAYQEVQRDQALRYTKTAVRFALKHAAAMASAFTLYQSMKSSEGQSAFAGPAAMAAYMSASYAISLSEKADTRHLSLMPNHLYVLDLEIPDGTYQTSLITDSHEQMLGQVELKNGHEYVFYSNY